jgi:tetratricopeptide (TPR) repeat protein
MLAHQAHRRSAAAAPAEEAGRGKRRERSARLRATQGAASKASVGLPAALGEESGARPLPWPRGRGARSAVALGLAAVAGLWVWGLARVAVAESAVSLGDTALMSGQIPTALRLYEEATRYDPGSAEAWEKYGLLEGRMGILYEEREEVKKQAAEEGERAIRRAMALEPTSFRWPASLGQLYLDMQKPGEAAKYYEQARERFPKNTKTLRPLAETYQLLGEEEAAASRSWRAHASAISSQSARWRFSRCIERNRGIPSRSSMSSMALGVTALPASRDC